MQLQTSRAQVRCASNRRVPPIDACTGVAQTSLSRHLLGTDSLKGSDCRLSGVRAGVDIVRSTGVRATKVRLRKYGHSWEHAGAAGHGAAAAPDQAVPRCGRGEAAAAVRGVR